MAKITSSNIKIAIENLLKGRVVAHATETCYGFTCDALNKSALSKLYKIKKMPKNKPISLLVADLKMAKKFGIFNKQAVDLAKKYWPGPLTIIVKRKKSLPKFINPRNSTVGFRVPGHRLSLKLVRGVGHPITTTSANVSGKESLYSAVSINKQFKPIRQKPDFILNSGKIKKNPPSTIVDTSKKKITIIRTGQINI